MKLEYRIIWVDDTPAWVDSVIDEVRNHLRDAECEPIIEILEQSDGVVDKCREQDFDLIIVDHNLPGVQGSVLISEIREAGKFTEVVFYSQDRPSQELIGVIDGVFHCQRADAPQKIKSVIDLTLHKLKDLGVVRGLVIASAIDIEVRLEQLIVRLFGESGTLFRERVLDKNFLDCAKKYMFLQGAVKDMLVTMKTGDAKNKLEAAKAILTTLESEIIENRNILAHSRQVIKDGKVVLKGINKKTSHVTFDTQWLTTMRSNLRKHLRNLRCDQRDPGGQLAKKRNGRRRLTSRWTDIIKLAVAFIVIQNESPISEG